MTACPTTCIRDSRQHAASAFKTCSDTRHGGQCRSIRVTVADWKPTHLPLISVSVAVA
eukprot:CAMPEP_0174923460 /NCGR_PEP_ID=MMETSP1355-20121228/6603_1 /TAXON_ID=464990 /ORGANISM="Hemiselmis tepida, Strain CCMP443" /LENGTH=57 /DNA_ID=CAMNT_0016169149 /DNA_START=5 /DNA_END=175 /DNA_ORIENTATION=+